MLQLGPSIGYLVSFLGTHMEEALATIKKPGEVERITDDEF